MEVAKRQDLEAIQFIYHQAIERTNQNGGFIDWPHPFPMERIERYLADHSLYKFTEDNQLVATIRMYENCSQEIWPDVNNVNALYIGKIATADKISGRNYLHNHIFPEVIDYAASKNFDCIRFDSLATNERQMKLYEKSPFAKVGEATIRSINNGNAILVAKWQHDLKQTVDKSLQPYPAR